jgi:hypothetical protein
MNAFARALAQMPTLGPDGVLRGLPPPDPRWQSCGFRTGVRAGTELPTGCPLQHPVGSSWREVCLPPVYAQRSSCARRDRRDVSTLGAT